MINPNELRIGNLIMHPEYGIWAWQFNRDDYDRHEMKAFHSIPISEDWLLKLGFTKAAETDDKINYVINPVDKLPIHIIQIKRTGEFIIQRRESWWINTIDIKTVHQLQNVYFALTGGEELKS